MKPLEMVFPGLAIGGYDLTSPAVPDYNCVAWAAGDPNRWWWPDPLGLNYWPPGIPREENIPSFQAAFVALGFEHSEHGDLETTLEKIALFSKGGKPTHMARQLENGRWTSKMGQAEDIEHRLTDLAGGFYGEVAWFMARARA